MSLGKRSRRTCDLRYVRMKVRFCYSFSLKCELAGDDNNVGPLFEIGLLYSRPR